MSFATLPRNPNARRRILRAARMGTRPRPVSPDYEDAFGTLQAVGRYVDAFNAEQVNVEFFSVLETAWDARHA